MDRSVDKVLLHWKDDQRRKPLVVRGARQVGKSYAVRQLGKSFPNFIEFNFDKYPEISGLFKSSLGPSAIVPKLEAFSDQSIKDGSTLVFFDEIQKCPEALAALRYFHEERPALHVIAAGSLLEFAIEQVGFPVGRVRSIYMNPMSFWEFLEAKGSGQVRLPLLKNHDLTKPIGDPLHALFLASLREYMAVGGMPEAVQEWISSESIVAVKRVHTDLLQTYRDDFGKYAKTRQIPYLEKMFAAAPLQLGSKFIYSSIAPDIKSRELKEALMLLVRAGLVHLVHHTHATGIPLGGEADLKNFKIIFLDIGLAQALLGSQVGSNLNHWLTKSDFSAGFSGKISEAFVGQELIAYADSSENTQIFYWRREAKSSSAEIDYLVQNSGKILPIEVKSGATGKLKSLRMFMDSHPKCKIGVRFSEHDFSLHQGIQSIPLYGVAKLYYAV